MCKEVNTLCDELLNVINIGYSIRKMKSYLYSEIGQNIIFHKECKTCIFWIIVYEIDNMYKIFKNEGDNCQLNDELKGCLKIKLNEYKWETRWDPIDDLIMEFD